MTAKVLAIYSSGFEVGLRPSNMSVCELYVGDGSSIVAYEATRREKSECSCWQMENMLNEK